MIRDIGKVKISDEFQSTSTNSFHLYVNYPQLFLT